MATTLGQTNGLQHSSASPHATTAFLPRSGNKDHAADSGFADFINNLASAPSTDHSLQASASAQKSSRSCKTASPEGAAAHRDAQAPQKIAQNQNNKSTADSAEKQNADDSSTVQSGKLDVQNNTDIQDNAAAPDTPNALAAELQTTAQLPAQNSSSSDALLETQMAQDNTSILPATQETNNTNSAPNNTKSALVAEALLTALQQVSGKNGQKTPSPTIDPSPQGADKKESLPTHPESGQQLSDELSENFLKQLTSTIKDTKHAEVFTNGDISFSNSKEEHLDLSTLLPKTSETPGNSDAFPVAGRESVMLQQATQTEKTSSSGIATRFDAGVSAPRTVLDSDLAENKAYFISNGNKLAVSLEPEGMGKLNINLSLDQGTLNAQIQAADPAAKTLIENNIQQIVDSLMREGLTVGGFSVSLKQGEAGSTNEQESGYSTKLPEKNITGPEAVRPYATAGRISLFV